MNIEFNSQTGCFQAQFSTDFNGDLAAVKTAGFRCSGPPTWVWSTTKISVLNKLRENRPISGLTISEAAYEQYTRLTEMERVNAEARKQFAPIAEEQKKAKKQRRKEQLEEQTYVKTVIPPKPGQDFDYLGVEDLPPYPSQAIENITPHLGPWCVYCRAPVFFYERQDPPTCLFCEIGLDKGVAVC